MTRILITALIGCVLSGVFGYFLLPVLRALKAGIKLRKIGPTWHNQKAGTPVMGGQTEWSELQDQLQEAVGVNAWLVKNGKISVTAFLITKSEEDSLLSKRLPILSSIDF